MSLTCTFTSLGAGYISAVVVNILPGYSNETPQYAFKSKVKIVTSEKKTGLEILVARPVLNVE